MDASNQSILQILKEKSNILNRKYQQFQDDIKNVMNEMMESQMNNENKSNFTNKMNELFDDYSLSMNRMEVEYLEKCEKCLQHQIKAEIDNQSSNSSNIEKSRPYKCEQCNISYTASSSLRRHNRKTHQNEDEYSIETEEDNHSSKSATYKCEECDISYTASSSLSRHNRKIHQTKENNTETAHFSDCNEQYNDNATKENDLSIATIVIPTSDNETELNEEIVDHINNNALQCDICFKLFKRPSSLKDHKIQCHTDGFSFICNYKDCNKSFKQKRRYHWHIRKEHNGYPLECTQCDQKFKYKTDLNKHQNAVHAQNNDTNPRRKRKLNENENALFINNNNNSIQQIEKEANKKKPSSLIDGISDNKKNDNSVKSTLYPQQQRRKKRKLYISDTDSDTDSYDDNNNNNNMNASNKEIIDSDNDIDMDGMNSNIQEKQFQCNICFKSFKNAAGLGSHAIHCKHRNKTNGVKQDKPTNSKSPYKCDECDDTFNIHSNLVQHKKWVHNQSNVSILSTPSNASNTSQNKSSHKAFECDVCHKKLVSLKGLKEHKLLHSGKRPYICSLCSKGFTSQKYLNQHIINIHNGNPWECDQCKERFRKKSDMLTHKKSTHQSNINTSKQQSSFIVNNKKKELNESENEELKLLHDIPDLDKIETKSNSHNCNDKTLINNRTKSLFNYRL